MLTEVVVGEELQTTHAAAVGSGVDGSGSSGAVGDLSRFPLVILLVSGDGVGQLVGDGVGGQMGQLVSFQTIQCTTDLAADATLEDVHLIAVCEQVLVVIQRVAKHLRARQTRVAPGVLGVY